MRLCPDITVVCWCASSSTTHAALNSSRLLRPRPTNLYLCSILDLHNQRPYLLPLTRQKHAFNSGPSLSEPREVHRQRYTPLLLNELLEPLEGADRTLVSGLVSLTICTLESTATTSPPALRYESSIGSVEEDFGIIPAVGRKKAVLWRCRGEVFGIVSGRPGGSNGVWDRPVSDRSFRGMVWGRWTRFV